MDIRDWLDTDLGCDIWTHKYQNNGESFEHWLDRISNGDELLKQRIIEKKFLFGGRILSNRGLQNEGKRVTFSNCYVMKNPQDNIEDIYRCCSDIARTFSMGGGCGICLDNLRPRGSVVRNSAKTTTGAVSFMETFSKVAETIGQAGRRGALMIALDVNHPDIAEFIDCKTDLSKVLGANISVKVDNNFMERVINNLTHTCEFFIPETGERIVKTVNARDLFMKLVQNNYDYAEPGILYWDTFNTHSLLDKLIEKGLFEYGGTNPCGEEPLPEGGACLLGSINLSEYVKYPFTKYAKFDLESLEKDVPIYVKALNDVLDENADLHPLDYQRECAKYWRQIGLGIMGLADVFIKMGIEYGSEESIALIHDIGYVLAYQSLLTSCKLNDNPAPFSSDLDLDLLADSWFVKRNSDSNLADLIREKGLYNSALLTVAPTGSISTMLGISGGIEPIFATSYNRRTVSLKDEEEVYKVYTPIIEQLMNSLEIENEEDLPPYVVTAHDIKPINRVKVQGAMQEHIDASISSTLNLKEEATLEDVCDVYINAWKYGLKGITIYRNNCKRQGILTTSDKEESDDPKELARGEWKPLAEDTYYVKRDLTIGCGKLKLFIGYSPSEQSIQDLYIVKTGQGGCEKNLQAIAISMSALLRVGGSLDQLEKAYSGITPCPSFVLARAKGVQLSNGNYCGMAIIKEVKKFLASFNTELSTDNSIQTSNVQCPECKEQTLTMQGGCTVCTNCGYTKCD